MNKEMGNEMNVLVCFKLTTAIQLLAVSSVFVPCKTQTAGTCTT